MARPAKVKTERKQQPLDQRIEWAIGIACGIATLAIIGFLTVEAFTTNGDLPLLSVEQRAVRTTANYFVLEVLVENEGNATAADVVVEGRLGSGDQAETSTVTIDYVPPGPGVPAALLFAENPTGADVELSVKGYTRP